MKRILTLLLAAILMLGLVACGEPAATTDTSSEEASASSEPSTGTVTSTDPDTSSSSDTSSDKTEKDEPLLYDESIDHMFIVTDITNHSIVVYDLDACDGDFTKLTDDSVAIVWEWDAEKDPNCKINPGAGIDSAKYRY